MNRLINLHLWPSHTYIFLGYYFDHDDMAWEGVDYFFPKLTEKKHKDPVPLLKWLNNGVATHSFRMFRSHLKMCRVKLGRPWKQPWPWKRTRTKLPSFLDHLSLVSAHTDPHLCDFLENHFLDEVKLIKKMATHMTNLCRLARPCQGRLACPNHLWVSICLRGSLSSMIKGCPHFSRDSLLCSARASLRTSTQTSQATRKLFSLPGAPPKSWDQVKTKLYGKAKKKNQENFDIKVFLTFEIVY